jgi:hypothetical protein
MTEDEAKTKWCPKVQLIVTSAGLSKYTIINNRGFTVIGPEDTLCIASRCACWVSTDNECFPTEPGHKSKSYPAGHCGLIK